MGTGTSTVNRTEQLSASMGPASQGRVNDHTHKDLSGGDKHLQSKGKEGPGARELCSLYSSVYLDTFHLERPP